MKPIPIKIKRLSSSEFKIFGQAPRKGTEYRFVIQVAGDNQRIKKFRVVKTGNKESK